MAPGWWQQCVSLRRKTAECFYMTNYPSEQTSSRPVRLAFVEHQARVSHLLWAIGVPRPSSLPGSEPGSFCIEGVRATSALPGPAVLIQITGSNLSKCLPQWGETAPASLNNYDKFRRLTRANVVSKWLTLEKFSTKFTYPQSLSSTSDHWSHWVFPLGPRTQSTTFWL